MWDNLNGALELTQHPVNRRKVPVQDRLITHTLLMYPTVTSRVAQQEPNAGDYMIEENKAEHEFRDPYNEQKVRRVYEINYLRKHILKLRQANKLHKTKQAQELDTLESSHLVPIIASKDCDPRRYDNNKVQGQVCLCIR